MPDPTISTKITAENEVDTEDPWSNRLLTFLGGRQTISKKFQIVSSMKKMKQCDRECLVYDQHWGENVSAET